jgi:hypothetical protein
LDACLFAGDSTRAADVAKQQLVALRRGNYHAEEQWMIDNILSFHAGSLDPDDLVAAAENSGYRNKYLAFAHWAIGLKYLARGDIAEAREHFRRCNDTRGFYFSYCWWARALDVQLEGVTEWPPFLN